MPDNTSEPQPLRVGIVGFGWMGQVHARAYTRLGQHYPDAPLAPVLVAVADNAADTRLAKAVAAYGFSAVHADWPDLVTRDNIDLVSITGPNFIHRDVAVAAARAGKTSGWRSRRVATPRRPGRSATRYAPPECVPPQASTTATCRRWNGPAG